MTTYTKAQILDDFATLPLDKLNRLYAYSKFLILPQEDLLTNVTMQQMVEKSNALADELFPEWTDRSETDFGMFLVELMALFSEKDFWYINAFARQTILRDMDVYSLAYLRSVELGARPDVFTASSATFGLVFVAGAANTYLTGDLKVKLEDGTIFTNTSPIVVPLTVSPFSYTTNLKQGEYASESLIFNGRNVDIRKKGVDMSTIELSINGTIWTRVNVFGQSGSTSTDYMVLPEEDGTCSIWFGDGTYGKLPDISDKIDLKYLFCKGADGNVALQTATITKSVTARACSSATMTTTSTNGVNGSSLSKLKNDTLNYFNYRKACINEDGTKTWLLSQPEVAKAIVFISGSTVNYFWYSKLGAAPTLSEQSVIRTRISPLVSNGFTPAYNATVFQNAGPITATAYYYDGYDPNEVESLAKQIIQDYTDPLVSNDFGKGFIQSEVNIACVSRITGLSNIVFNTIAGGPAADITSSYNQLLNKVALGNISLTMVKV